MPDLRAAGETLHAYAHRLRAMAGELSTPQLRDAGQRVWRHRIPIAVGGAVVIVLAYAVPAAASAGRLPGGILVAGVDIGGLPAAEAEAKLRRELADDATRPIKVAAGRRTLTIDPAKAGLALDTRATVAAADDGLPSPPDLLRSLFGGREVAPRVRVDTARLAAAVAGIADTVDRPKRDTAVRYEGLQPVAVPPKPGKVIDRAGAAARIRAAFLTAAGPVRLPVRADTPTVTLQQARKVAATTARTAVAAPVNLRNGPHEAALTPRVLAANLRFVADGRGGMRPAFDAAAVADGLEKTLIGDDQAPRDATYEISGGTPRLVPSRSGQGIDTGRLAASVAQAVTASGAQRDVTVQVSTAAPRLTTEQVEKFGITERISTYTTRHPCCAPRVTNIHTIADILDGYIVKPGETFSLNTVVGDRDKARGFVPAPQILRGRFVDDVGGGISQFTTTMFNAVFFGGLQDVQHTPHQFYISRYPPGRESTVSYPNPDFRWRNDSPYGVLVKTAYTDTSITVSFWSTKRFDVKSKSSKRYDVRSFETAKDSGDKCIPMPGAEGFAIDVWRIFERDGKTVKQQKFHTVYQPEPKLTCE